MKKINEAARALGKLGGKKSAESRLGGKTKEQKSELMRRVRLSKTEGKRFGKMLRGSVDSLNSEVTTG